MNDSDPAQGSISRHLDGLAASDETTRNCAQEAIFRKLYWQFVQRAWFTLDSHERAESAAAEAFGNVFNAAAEGRFPVLNNRDDLCKLLATTVKLRVIDRLRRLKREGKVPMHNMTDLLPAGADDADVASMTEQIAATELSPWHARECDQMQAEFVESLSLTDREVFQMHDLRGAPVPEIAGALGVAACTIYRRLQKIHDALYEFVGQDGNTGTGPKEI